jgi:hypothetical protein
MSLPTPKYLQDRLKDHDVPGGILISAGDTASRDPNPIAGIIYMNTELGKLQIYDGADWQNLVFE